MTTPPSSLRITQLIHYFHPGGLEQLALRLASSYQALGVESHVIAYEDGPLREKFEQAGIITHVLPRPSRISPRFVFRLAKLLLHQKFDILHTHHIGPMLYGVPAAHLCGIPVIHTTHSNEHLHSKQELTQEGAVPSYRKTFRRLAQYCHHIVTVNEKLETFLREDVKISQTPITAVPNGIDPTQFHGKHDTRALEQELQWPEDEPRLGVVGRLEPEKGHRYLLEAMRDLSNPPQLLVVGDGSLRDELTTQTLKANMHNKVHFLGLRHDLPQLFSSFDIMVLPSLREGLPLVLLEAMASGVPIIATAVGSVPEVLQSSGAGVVVPPGDSTALKQAIESLLQSPETCEKMAQAGKRWATLHYSQEKMVQEYLAIINQCIQHQHTPFWLKPFHQVFLLLSSIFPEHKTQNTEQ